MGAGGSGRREVSKGIRYQYRVAMRSKRANALLGYMLAEMQGDYIGNAIFSLGEAKHWTGTAQSAKRWAESLNNINAASGRRPSVVLVPERVAQ
jgi:hypothetical protein